MPFNDKLDWFSVPITSLFAGDNGQDGRERLLPVLTTLLQLSPQEVTALKAHVKGKSQQHPRENVDFGIVDKFNHFFLKRTISIGYYMVILLIFACFPGDVDGGVGSQGWGSYLHMWSGR